MWRNWTLFRGNLVVILFCMAHVLSASAQSLAPGARDYAPGVVLVGMESVASSAYGKASETLALQFIHGGDRSVRGYSLARLSVPIGQEQESAMRLRREGRVAFAELDYAVHADDARLPNDPRLAHQWALTVTHAAEAWGIITGTAQIVIAVIDSGLALDHPDLVAKVWRNPGEIPQNGLDDDGNGKVDDLHGWHYYHTWINGELLSAEDADVRDEYGHGTHVAGIAAAATNNGVGIAGLSWGARLMSVRALDQAGDGWYSDIASAILYAADNGARIINLSLGGAQPSETLCAAVAYARRKGCLVVAATGKTGGAVEYPAACAGALAVAASDSSDEIPAFSNRGAQVDLAAPGVEIYSTWHRLDGYLALSGTSMAAPYVSGVAALVWSRWPTLSDSAVSRQITATVVDLGSPGWDAPSGWGRLDAAAAVGELVAREYGVPIPLIFQPPFTAMY